MSTEIDSILISIESSGSSGAIGAIKDLSGALEGLKKNGSIGTATKNLRALADELKGFDRASHASQVLGKLAGGIERLKSVGSVAAISNSLKKLKENLAGLDNIDIDNVAPQLERVAIALGPLSAVKAGGINTMMNGLQKLGKVTKELDDDKIAAFAEKVKKLNEVLEPLSQKMTTIAAGFKGVNSVVRTASRGTQDLGSEVNATTLNMASMITVVQGVIAALQPLIRLLTETISAAIEWDGIAARFGRGFGTQAQETYEWIQRLNEEMGINVQQFMQYSSVYATMLTGFGVAHEDAGKMALGYTELTYDIWAGYNDVYNGFADAAEAVKSALSGEVEPIRRAGFTIIESTLKQTAANHGLNISLEKATEAQKSYLRYLTLVDQAHAQGLVGTYAKELNTAEGLMRTFSQQLKSLAQAFGSLFLPVLVKVMPYVQAFVELLTEAVALIAGFFGIEIQPVSWEASASGIGSVSESADAAAGSLDKATKAAKELKNATLGIDELNVISPPSASGGGGGGGGAGGGSGFDGLDVDSLWDESIFDGIQTKVDSIKEKFKEWLPTIAGIGTALAGLGLAKLLNDLDLTDTKFAKFDSKIKGLAKGLAVASIAIAVGTIVWDLTGAYLESGDVSDWLKILGTTAIGTALAYFLAGPAGAGFVLATSGVVSLTKLSIELAEGEVDFGDPQVWVTAITGGLETAIGGVLTWKTIGPMIKKAIPGLTAKLSAWLTGGGIASLTAALPYVALAAAVVGNIVLAFVDYDFTEIGSTVGEKVGKALKWTFENLTPLGLAIKLGNWLKKELDVDTILEVVGALFKKETWTELIFPKISEIFTAIGDWIEDKLDNLAGNIGEFQDGFLEGLGKAFNIDFSGLDFLTVNDFGDILAGFSPITAINNFVEDAIKQLASSFGLEVEEKKTSFTNVGKSLLKNIALAFVPNSIRNMIIPLWTNAKNWFDKDKPKMKEYTPSIGNIKDIIVSRWSSAFTYWKDRKPGMKTYTPPIGSIYEKVSERWKNAYTWYNNKKPGMKTYTPSIGSIKDKVVSAWNTAFKWWKSNAKLSTKLDIKVPKITVKWDTAEAFGKSFKYPTGFKLSFAADGGIFKQGSLIWAGEHGAEIAASAPGGRTGVMNVQQMQDAVYEGVYAAMAAAMRSGGESGGEMSVNVYLDGRQISRSVEKSQKERGASIMGNQVMAY